MNLLKWTRRPVDLGSASPDGLLPDLSKAVFAAAKDAIVGPIKSPLGWHILKVTDIDPGFTKKLEDVRDQLTEIVRRDHAIDALYKLSVRFEDQIGGGATLEEAAAAVGASAVSIEAVDREGKTPCRCRSQGPGRSSPACCRWRLPPRKNWPVELTQAGDKGFFMVLRRQDHCPALQPLDRASATELIHVRPAGQRQKSAETQAKRNSSADFRRKTALASLLPARCRTPSRRWDR